MARQTHHQPQHQGCGQDCTYRGLYEGTQASLADMARRQTEALRRVGRLRAAIVMLLKRHFPQAFTQAEANIGTRLSESDDEVLLAYLTGFVGNNPDGSSEQYIMLLRKLSMLKTELLAAGIPLSNDDPQSWVETIRIWRKHKQPNNTNITGDQGTSSAGGSSTIALINIDQETAAETPKSDKMTPNAPLLGDLFAETRNANESRDNNSHGMDPTSLGDLFGDSEPGNGDVSKDATHKITDRNNSGQTLGDIFGTSNTRVWSGELGAPTLDDSGRWLPTPLQAQKGVNPFLNEKDGKVVSETPAIEVSKVGRSGTKLNQTAESVSTPSESISDNPKNHSNESIITNQNVQDVSVSTDPEATDDTEGDSTTVESRQVNWVNPFDAPPGLLPDFDIEKDTENTMGLKHIATTGTITRENDNTTPQGLPSMSAGTDNIIKGAVSQPAQGVSQPLRPELFPVVRPTKTNRRGTKTPRARAERPDPHLLDIPIDYPDTSELSLETRQKLLASCLIPRPVFTSDLLSVAGSNDVVSSWEAELRADPATSPVRFLAAKGRHRLRGSLVIPVSEAREIAKGTRLPWWSDCVSLYRGSRLYELGVVLHRVGEEIVAARFDENVAVLRLSSPRGLVGVVVVFDTNINEEPARIALRESIEQLLKERLTLIAVLTSAGEAIALTNLTETVASLALSEQWSRNIPVIAARSWEFADDRGSTAHLVFGG
jgi:hypothetical protein